MSLNAIQPTTVQQVNPALIEYVDNKFVRSYEIEADLWKLFQQKTDDKPTNFRGRRQPIELTPNPSLAAGNPNGGILATPGAPSNNNLTITYQWLDSGYEVTYEALMNANQNTLTDPVKRGIDSTSDSLAFWLNCYTSNGDGTWKLAGLTAAYDGTNSTTQKTFAASGATDGIGATQLRVGQRVLVFDPTGTTQRTGTVGSGSLVIATLSKTGGTTTTNLPSDMASGDIIVPEGTLPGSSGIKGLPFITATTTGQYFGLSKTTYPQLQPNVTNVGGALTAAALLGLNEKMWQRGATNANNVGIFMGIAQHYNYANLIGVSPNTQHYVHSGNQRPKFDIGGDSFEMSFFGQPIYRLKRVRADQIYYLNFDYLHSAILKKMGSMMDIPSGDWLQAIDSSANYLAAKQRWYDLALDNYSDDPRQLGALTGLTFSGAPSAVS